MLDNIRLWLLSVLLPKQNWSQHTCANRVIWKARVGPAVEVTLTIRHLGMPDGYSREELVEMLETVRRHEKEQGWQVPEPEKT